MKTSLKNMLPFAEGIAKLLHPFAEVVVHDLKKDCIEAIYNPFSQREVGDDSYLERITFTEKDSVIGPYEKTNWDGRKLKCVSIVVRNDKAKVEGFVCINLDVSHFEHFESVLSGFLGNNAPMSDEEQRLFKDDLYERINSFVQTYCREHHLSINALQRQDKRSIVHLLDEEGAFEQKNAAAYIGRVLGISRATVYNYLKEER
ncbi:MAG: PAS domain-containing protein [Bdellovibrionales bacterium]|nr:PAS domain-containing protein [Bdellovibrionales bacterium]